MPETRQVQCRVQGEMACFTRPEMKVERVSYEVITPSAARGILENVFRKPEMYWEVRQIAVLAPIVTTEFCRNEVKSKARPGGRPFYIEDERTQRNTVALINVDYVITAVIGLTRPVGERATLNKYVQIFEHRVALGQQWKQPYFGCREFPAWVSPAPAQYTTYDEKRSRDLGWMFYDYDYTVKPPLPMVFRARLERGVLHVPTHATVLGDNNTSRYRRAQSKPAQKEVSRVSRRPL